MKRNRDNPYSGDDILGKVFKALASDDVQALRSTHIPRSEVYYTREKYFQDTGHWVELDRMERAMYLEGMIPARDCNEPSRKRDWE